MLKISKRILHKTLIADISLVDRLSGLKYSHEDKIKKVKLIDEELLNLRTKRIQSLVWKISGTSLKLVFILKEVLVT